MPAAAPSVDLSAVRAWARDNGVKVGDRGRLPAGLVEQFLTANPTASNSKQKANGKATVKPAAAQTMKPATRSKAARSAPASTRVAVAAKTPQPAGPGGPAGTSKATAKAAAAAAEPEDVDAMLLDDEQVELLKDLPAVLEDLNTELDELQQALKDVQAENAQLKQRLDRLENKRGLFNRK